MKLAGFVVGKIDGALALAFHWYLADPVGQLPSKWRSRLDLPLGLGLFKLISILDLDQVRWRVEVVKL